MSDLVPRAELERPYRHPYRHWLPTVARVTPAAPVLAGGAAAAAGGLLAGGGWAFVGVAAALVAVVCVAQWLAIAARSVRRRTRDWDVPSELEDVRAARPHAHAAHPDVAHDEFAVTVEDDGELLLWRFRPLGVDEDAAEDELAVPGRPRHAASVVARRRADTTETTTAAAQLAEAQADAARREHEAADAAAAWLAGDDDRRLAATTTAALQRVTGQRRRS